MLGLEGWREGAGGVRVLVIFVCCPLHSCGHSTSSKSGSRITNIKIPVLRYNKAPYRLNTYAEPERAGVSEGCSSLPFSAGCVIFLWP